MDGTIRMHPDGGWGCRRPPSIDAMSRCAKEHLGSARPSGDLWRKGRLCPAVGPHTHRSPRQSVRSS